MVQGAKSLKLHSYQDYCVDKILELPSVGIFLDPGMGKTAITLSAILELRYHRWSVGRVLIVAPKKVAEATWQKEASLWIELAPLTFSTVLGSAAQRIAALHQSADIYVINRENVQWLVDYYRNKWPFDMVVLDESSSFKNHRARRFRALKSVRPHIRRLVELTGTPSPHGLTDLWAQVYLLDGGQRLGRTISVYRDLYFVPDKRSRDMIYSYAPKEGAPEEIRRLISDICISMKAEDYLTMPELVYDDIPVVLDPAAKRAYDRLEREMLLKIDADTTITASTQATLTGKLLQLCNGAVYGEDGMFTSIHTCKLEAFLELVEALNGQHAIVYYNFQHDLSRLEKTLLEHGARIGNFKGSAYDPAHLRVRVYKGADDADAWNAGEVDLLLAQPQSCSYGLNLQAGGHHVIWFGLIWSLEQYIQANRRLYRQGQRHPVVVHHLIVQGGRDEDVMKALASNENVQESLLASLRVRLESAKAARAGR